MYSWPLSFLANNSCHTVVFYCFYDFHQNHRPSRDHSSHSTWLWSVWKSLPVVVSFYFLEQVMWRSFGKVPISYLQSVYIPLRGSMTEQKPPTTISLWDEEAHMVRKKKWENPQLIVLVRTRPEERVLDGCKYWNVFPGYDTFNWGCWYLSESGECPSRCSATTIS